MKDRKCFHTPPFHEDYKGTSKRIRCLSEFWVPLFADLTLLHAQGHIQGTTTSNRHRRSQFMKCIQPAKTLCKWCFSLFWQKQLKGLSGPTVQGYSLPVEGRNVNQLSRRQSWLPPACQYRTSTHGMEPLTFHHGEWPNPEVQMYPDLILPTKLTTNSNHCRWTLTSRD